MNKKFRKNIEVLGLLLTFFFIGLKLGLFIGAYLIAIINHLNFWELLRLGVLLIIIILTS